MIEPTKISLPVSVKFPVVITGFLQKEQTNIEKHTPLLKYKYWDYIEEPILDGEDDINDNDNDNEKDIEHETTTLNGHGKREKSLTPIDSRRKSTTPPINNTRKVRKEFHSSFEAPVKGILEEYLFNIGERVENSHQPIVSISEPCTHSVQYGGLCALCGSSLDEQDYTEFNNTDRAPISMSHDTSGLKVSYNEAERIEKSSSERLLDERKLILVVDLDQTVIHAAVDPTIGEWMRDEKNPNHASLKDVETFCLEETLPVSPRMRGSDKIPPPQTTMCWYYVKLRPGLDSFLKSMADIYEMHIYTMATKSYAKAIAKIIDPNGVYFADRILSRDDSGSLLQKSLKRLFPVSTSMVAVIDDRGDVWKWSNNLIKVVPYNFFVGIGDINSSFLPQRTGIIESSMKRRKSLEAAATNDLIGVDKKEVKEVDEKEKGEVEEKEKKEEKEHQKDNIGNISNSTTSDSNTNGDNDNDNIITPMDISTTSSQSSETKPIPEVEIESDTGSQIEPELDIEPEPELSPVEQLVAIGGGEDNVELLTVQASERSASLEAQQIERPLAKLQKDLERKLHHEDPSDENQDRPTTSQPDLIDNNQSDHVLNDNDNELQHLENALKRVHSSFYSEFDSNPGSNPDLSEIIPQLKSKVFDGCVFLLSGIVPLGRNFDTYDIVQWVRSFGAVVVADLIDSVTHVIATSGGTFKVRMAAGHPNIKIVYSDWVYACIAAWKRVPESDYLIEVIDPILPEVTDNHWLKNTTSTQPEESNVENFHQSLTDGNIDWDEADKELEEFMASDNDEDDGEEEDDDNDNENDDSNDNDNEDSTINRKRERSTELLDEPSSKSARIEQEDDDSYDEDEFAKELENDLM